MSEENKNQDELRQKRESRRKRRQRNQILAYLAVLLVIALLAFAILAMINAISKMPKKEPTQKSYPSISEETESEPEGGFETAEFSSEPEETSSEPEETEPVVTELTHDEKLDQIVNAAIEVMPLEDKVAGLFIVTPELLTGVSPVIKAGDSTKAALDKYAVCGILYRSQNVKNADYFKTMTENTIAYSRYPVFLAVEEECGSVNQLVKAKLGSKTDDAKTIAESGDYKNAYQAGQTIGTYLKEYGLTLDLAPVADLACIDKSLMNARSFGNNAEAVFPYVTNMMKGLEEQGITSCVKHFPGMGSVTTDTEKGRAVSERSEEDFWANEMDLFRKLVEYQVPMIMISNMAVPSLVGDNTPCTLSEKIVTEILRQQLGFRGVIITDALNEKAVSEYYSSEEAAVLALKAGCDVILCPENFEQAYNGVIKAVQEGTISEERINDALRRIYRIKYADRVE